jgi:hypothetical protein
MPFVENMLETKGFSLAVGLKSGQSNRKRNSEKANNESSSGGLQASNKE